MKFNILMTFVLAMILFASQGFCNGLEVRKGKIILGYGVTTGMNLTQVKNELADEKYSKLKIYKRAKGFNLYNKVGTSVFYVFSGCSGKLIYKLTVVDHETYKKAKKFFKKICGRAYNGRGGEFYRSGDLGVKLIPYEKDNLMNLWQGSIELWNDFIKNCNSSSNLFPEW